MQKRTKRTRFAVFWWMSGMSYGLVNDNPEMVKLFVDTRNAVTVEVLRDGKIAHVLDWYWRDDADSPMEAIWHEHKKAPERWGRKYLLIWWKRARAEDEAGVPHAIVMFDRKDAHEFAKSNAALLIEIIHRGGDFGKAADYKFYDKNGKPVAVEWKNQQDYQTTTGPWRGPIVLRGLTGRRPRA